jgi:hypothetical protein
MLGQIVRYGPDRFKITEWDWQTKKVSVEPHNSALETLLQKALENHHALLFYPASGQYAVAKTKPDEAAP